VELAKLNLKNPQGHMKARILFWLGCVLLGGCNEPKVSSDERENPVPAPSTGSLYLARRVAVATEESLYGLKAGMELKLIETRPEGFLVEAESMRFEIDARDTTRDRDLAETLLAREQPGEPTRQSAITKHWLIEDRKFLAEENIRRSAEEAHLRKPANQPRAH
jgi:hypothetical protein